MNKSFHLHMPCSGDDGTTQVQPDVDLPAEVAGQPAAYFWKEMIHAGHYVHPTRGYALDVDGDRLHRWFETGANMLAAGVPVPINCDHSDRARDVVGYVKQFKLDGDQLLGLCQFIGPDAALTAARNWVSVGINPDFTDGEARNWGEAIVHLALTPVPVVPDQGEFVDASDDDTLVLTPEVEVSTASPAVELSTFVPAPLGDEAEAALVEAATFKFDAAVAQGGLSPAARDRLLATLVRAGDGKVNLYAMSRAANPAGDRALALAVADILLENQPIALGERTGLQAFARPIPGEESSPIEQLRQYMTKVASVSG